MKNILKTSDKDSQVYFDLAELENKVQLKWLTTLEQQQKWLIPDSIHLWTSIKWWSSFYSSVILYEVFNCMA